MMMLQVFTLLSMVFSPAFAGDDTRVEQSYACVSLDGLPVQNGTQMAKNCCTADHHLVANAPKSCRAFNGIGSDAAIDAAFSIDIAQNTLNLAGHMSGASVNFEDGKTNPSKAPQYAGESNAIVQSGAKPLDESDPQAKAETSSKRPVAQNTLGKTADSDGTAAANAANFGSGPGQSGKSVLGKGAVEDSSAQALAYVGSSRGRSSGAENRLQGSVARGTVTELKMENESAQSTAKSDDEENASGTAIDPEDYFQRIDPSASLFKIVSARYLRKKSLYELNGK